MRERRYIDYGRREAPPETDQADLERRMGGIPDDVTKADVLRALASFGPQTAVKLLRYFAGLAPHDVVERYRSAPWGTAPTDPDLGHGVIFKKEGEHDPVPIEVPQPVVSIFSPQPGMAPDAPLEEVHYWDEAPESCIPAALLADRTQQFFQSFQYSYSTSAGTWFTATEATVGPPPAAHQVRSFAESGEDTGEASQDELDEALERAIREREEAEHRASARRRKRARRRNPAMAGTAARRKKVAMKKVAKKKAAKKKVAKKKAAKKKAAKRKAAKKKRGR